jgi:hypothetical protein
LSPKKLAEAALTGTLDQTIADLSRKFVKPIPRPVTSRRRTAASKPVDTKAEVRIQFLKDRLRQIDEEILIHKALGDKKKVLSLQSSRSRFRKELRKLEGAPAPAPPAPPKPRPEPKPKADPRIAPLQEKMADLYRKLDAAKLAGDKRKVKSIQSSLSVTRRKIKDLGGTPIKAGQTPIAAPTPAPAPPPPPKPKPKPEPTTPFAVVKPIPSGTPQEQLVVVRQNIANMKTEKIRLQKEFLTATDKRAAEIRERIRALDGAIRKQQDYLRNIQAKLPPEPEPVFPPEPEPTPKPAADPKVTQLQNKMADLYIKLDVARAAGDKKKIASIQSSLSVTRKKLRALGAEPIGPGQRPGVVTTPPEPKPAPPPTPKPKPKPKVDPATAARLKTELEGYEKRLTFLENKHRANLDDPLKKQIARLNEIKNVRAQANIRRKKLGIPLLEPIFRPEDPPFVPAFAPTEKPKPKPKPRKKPVPPPDIEPTVTKPDEIPPPRGKPGEYTDAITEDYRDKVQKGKERVARAGAGTKAGKLHQKVVDLNQRLLDERLEALEKFQGNIPIGYLHDKIPKVKIDNRVRPKLSTKDQADPKVVRFIDKAGDTLKRIGEVHQVPTSMSSIIYRTVAGTTSEGSYNPGTRVIKLNIDSANKPRHRTTVWHEFGHAVDDNIVGFSSWGSASGGTVSNKYESQSPHAKRAITNLRDVIADDDRVKKWKESVKTGKFGKKAVTPSYMEYIASDEEIFARAYSQYISEKLGDGAATRALLADGKKRQWGYGQWTDAGEFDKIFEAFDELFGAMGMSVE